jgi:hypothetical protein
LGGRNKAGDNEGSQLFESTLKKKNKRRDGRQKTQRKTTSGESEKHDGSKREELGTAAGTRILIHQL